MPHKRGCPKLGESKYIRRRKARRYFYSQIPNNERKCSLNKHQTLTPEQKFSEMAANTGITPETAMPPDKPVIMLKRIGTTTYQVAVYVSNTSRETISDKVSRMIKNDVESEVVGL